MTFLELKKNAKKDASQFSQKAKLAVLGDSATQLLCVALKGYAYAKQLALEIFDADYDQIELQTADKNSELYKFAPDFALLFMCTEKLYQKFNASAERINFAEITARQIFSYWENISSNLSANSIILQFCFVEKDDAVWGNFSLNNEGSFLFQIKKLNFLLMQESVKRKNVFLLDLNKIKNSIGENLFCDNKLYYTSKMPLSLDAMPLAAKAVISAILTQKGFVKKCVIFDLDNTVWGGVIGDDGINGIQLGELGIGRAFTDLQVWLKELGKRGIILCVCSKNNEETAKEVFEKHPDMVLRLSDISVFVANWQDKASNICQIQKTLNIGMDSIVFIDDNPFERNLVKEMIPQITVPDLPSDPSLYLSYLQNLNLFETASWSASDAERTAQYQAEAMRVESQKKFETFEDYLKSLDMQAQVKKIDDFTLPRIAQLSQRSNQFNLRTVRYTEQQVEKIAKSPDYETRYFTLSDKFGNHGLVSVLVMKREAENFFIENWFMSCRVLRRGMEEFIVNSAAKIAHEFGIKKIIGEFIPTSKNSMVKDIYEKLGFKRIAENRFELAVTEFSENPTCIEEV